MILDTVANCTAPSFIEYTAFIGFVGVGVGVDVDVDVANGVDVVLFLYFIDFTISLKHFPGELHLPLHLFGHAGTQTLSEASFLV